MDDAPIELVLDGRTYRRYPGSGRKNAERYYTLVNGDGFRTYHRDLWEKLRGPIPAGYHIHHADLNPLNNDIGNYECLSPAEHAAKHITEERSERSRDFLDTVRHLSADWHRSPAGLEWHREHGKQSWGGRERQPLAERCAGCGGEIRSFFASGGDRRFCSRKCFHALAEREKRYFIEIACPVCSKPFKSRYGKPETCSRLCGASLRKSRRAGLQPAR